MTINTRDEVSKVKCPNCGEEDLVHNIKNRFQCNSCECIWKDQKQLLVIEVKRDWNLNVTRNQDVVRQAYGYALENGVRFVIVSNGDYYAIFDRLRGLSFEDNLLGEFTLTALEESDLELIKLIEPNTLISPNFRDTILAIAENFKG